MVQVLAVRDNDTRQVVVCEELPADHEPQKTYLEARTKYPAPRYEVVLGGAASLDDFVQNYPRFRRGTVSAAPGGTKPAGGDPKGGPGEPARPPAETKPPKPEPGAS